MYKKFIPKGRKKKPLLDSMFKSSSIKSSLMSVLLSRKTEEEKQVNFV